MTTQASPVNGVFAFLDPLFCRTSFIVKFDYIFGFPMQIGDDESHPGKQLSGVPFDLGHHATRFVPKLIPVLEARA